MIFAVEAAFYALFGLMALHAFAPGEDDTWVILFFVPFLLLPAIVLTLVRRRVLKLKLWGEGSEEAKDRTGR